MIDIKDIKGSVILSVPITQSSQRVEELMVSDYIQLSWNSHSNEELPVGSYIEYNGERFSLLEPYKPTQKNEVEYTYTPQFKSKIMRWGKMPFFFYSEYNGIVSKEPDWTLTSNPADFMKCICDAIKNETGENWTYSIDASLPASASLSFSTIDILSGLNEIASAFETEWYADKFTKTLYLGKAEFGNAVTLKVGENIQIPSTNNTKEGYYTRFYAFGSTRNIAQDYKGANVNNLVNKRLTLDPAKYPNGYKDIREGLKEGEIFSKVLIFDNVYPSSKLSISGVRPRLMYRLDDSGNKIQLGTDESGNPIYDQYAIWYFRIEGFDFDVSNILEGHKLSVSFESGSLAGREFELKYYEKDENITTSDGITFQAKKGDYEILFIEESDYIIPSMTGLVPNDGDNIVLFNIKMPSEYTQSAYEELEAELDNEIERSLSDLNNYSFKSNPVAFNDNNPNLSIGRKVTYVNGDYSYTTRVIKLTTQLDFPIEQDITIGNEKVKGNTQQLKEEVATANKDLNLLAMFNDMTQSLQQSYARTQQMMLDGFASIKNIWQLRTDKNGKMYAYSAYDLVSQYGLTMYGDNGADIPTLAEGLPFDQRTIWFNTETGQIEVIGGTGGGEGGVSNFWDLSGIPSWITNTKPKYSYSEIEGTPDLSVLVTGTALSNTLADYATLTHLTGELKKYVTINYDQEIVGIKNFLNGIKIGNMPIRKLQDDVIYIDANVVVRGGVTMFGTNEVDLPTIKDEIGFAGYNGSVGLASFDSTQFVISANGTVSVKGGSTGLDTAQLAEYLTTNKYATQGWVTSQGYASASNLTALQSKVDNFLEGSDSDTIINKWLELEAFLSGLSESDNLATILSNKANKANTLAGYGITDAYTKTQVDNTFKLYIPIAGYTEITGEKNFTGGLRVNNSPVIYYDEANKYWKLEGDLLVTGGVSMYSDDSEFTPSTIMDGVVVDGTSIRKNPTSGALEVIGGSGSTTKYPLSWSGFNQGSYDGSQAVSFYIPTALSEFVNDKNFATTSDLSRYLPLSGGTVSNNAFGITINRESANNAWLRFDVQGTFAGAIGANNGVLEWMDNNSASHTILHSGNYSSYALPLSGGKLSGTLQCDLIRSTNNVWIYGYDSSNQTTSFGSSNLNYHTEVSGNTVTLNAYSDSVAVTGFVKLAATGYVGIGVTSPSERLDVAGYVKSSDGYNLSNTTASYCGLVAARRVTNGGDARDIWLYNNYKIYIYGDTGVTVATDLLVSGGITMYSDIRKKTKLQDVELSLSQIANAPLIQHYYNSDQNKITHVGSIAQYWAGLNDWFCKEDSEGFLTMEIQNCALASAISIARELDRYETKTDKTIRKMKQRIAELEEEVERLKNN